MTLSAKDLKVLSAVQLDATMPIPRLANLTGLPAHTVRYSLERLLRDKYTLPISMVDVGALGLQRYSLFVVLNSRGYTSLHKLLQFFRERHEVSWVGTFAGVFDFGLCLRGHCPAVVHSFLEKVDSRFGMVFQRKVIGTYLSWTFFGSKYSAPAGRAPFIQRTGKPSAYKLDSLDHNLLSYLMSNPLGSIREFSQHQGLAMTTVAFRQQRLRERGVLQGAALVVNPTRIGVQGHYALLHLKSITAELDQKLHLFCSQSHPVSSISNSIGAWDYEVALEVSDLRELKEFEASLLKEFGDNISGVELLSRGDDIKNGGALVPPDRDDGMLG